MFYGHSTLFLYLLANIYIYGLHHFLTNIDIDVQTQNLKMSVIILVD